MMPTTAIRALSQAMIAGPTCATSVKSPKYSTV